jgi:2-polyprenyl-3-methyl-5-hydroxy-6-metoxy-1,4-benzoquinol methylase
VTTPGPWSTREDFEEALRQPSDVVPKEELICRLCAGKSVLDVGCVDESVESALAQGDRWLHARISKVAKEAVGLDFLEGAVQALQTRGYAIVTADAESFSLGRTFEVVVAADIVEHLSNVGRFLDSARRHMSERSLLVITTPNPFNVEQFFHALVSGTVNVNPTHTQWFDPRTLRALLERHGFDVLRFHWVGTKYCYPLRPLGAVRHRLLNRAAAAIMKRRPGCRRDFGMVCRLQRPPIKPT